MVLATFVSLVMTACTSVPEPTANRLQEGLSGTTVTSDLPAFVHTAEHSRFALGEGVTQRTEFKMTKLVGSDGVFASRANGWAMALPNAGAPAEQLPSLTTNGEIHNNAVRAYFIGSGLPADQIGSVQAMPMMAGGGETAKFDPAVSTQGNLVAFYTLITRKVGGIEIADSYAWARMDVNGDVVSESAYWPEIPASVLADARSLAQTIAANGQAAQSLLSKLPTGASGHVAIRHTAGVWDGAFAAFASYDLLIDNRIRHFDATGKEIFLPSEAPVP